jgi:hypothetical protein
MLALLRAVATSPHDMHAILTVNKSIHLKLPGSSVPAVITTASDLFNT